MFCFQRFPSSSQLTVVAHRARALFKEALELLRTVSKTSNVFDGFVEAAVPLSEAPKYYKLFDERKIGKVVFTSG